MVVVGLAIGVVKMGNGICLVCGSGLDNFKQSIFKALNPQLEQVLFKNKNKNLSHISWLCMQKMRVYGIKMSALH